MAILDVFKNEVKAALGYQQSFAELLASKDVTRAISMMRNRSVAAADNLLLYETETHKVMERKDRPVFDKKGQFLRWSKRWKIPIPYQVFINEIALVFLYGRPVKWTQLSEGTDDAYENYKNLMDEIRFDAHVREAKRAAGAEGTSAMLYHVYKNSDNEPKLLLNVLSKKNGDDIYTIKDQYKRLTAFAWGYYLTDTGNKTVYHVDIYTSDFIYRAKRGNIGWEVNIQANPIGNIPVLLVEQDPESSDVEPMIESTENLTSVDADVCV